jgi:hypothetical protein
MRHAQCDVFEAFSVNIGMDPEVCPKQNLVSMMRGSWNERMDA